jgi:hypothetical protein
MIINFYVDIAVICLYVGQIWQQGQAKQTPVGCTVLGDAYFTAPFFSFIYVNENWFMMLLSSRHDKLHLPKHIKQQ